MDPATWELIGGHNSAENGDRKRGQDIKAYPKEHMGRYYEGWSRRIEDGQREGITHKIRGNGWERIRERVKPYGRRDEENWRETPCEEGRKKEGKELDGQTGKGKRNYVQSKGPTQTTLDEVWASKDTRTWVEQIEEMEAELDKERQASVLSYV
ncbi:hypothetical protein BYT27DRAFT_7264187 [Phlegmacium glaucopus]|nr:hypothetical protein BYT27DRAFT_7264187 [Phlegmacium glaucopus]